MTDSVYRPTRNFCDTLLQRFGVETTYYDPLVGADIARCSPNTRAVFTEAPGSQSFEMQDVPAIAAVAHARDAIVLMDNTWATPLFFPPHERGVDLAIEAGTKYLSGHSDLLLGLVSANAALLEEAARDLRRDALCAGPEDVFLALRGLRTMGVRLPHHQQSALASRAGSQQRPEVAARAASRRSKPIPATRSGSATSPARPGCSASCSSRCRDAAVACLPRRPQLFGMGSSWGGFESLAIPFDCASLPHRDDMESGRTVRPLPHRA